jgi:hypothetical protein
MTRNVGGENIICVCSKCAHEMDCSICNGSGLVTIQYGGDDNGYGAAAALCDADDQPCPECNEGYWRVKP